MNKINRLTVDSVPEHSSPVEIVVRKGIGHPDTMCDALAEELRLIYKQMGMIL